MIKTILYYGFVVIFVLWCLFLFVLNRNVIPGVYVFTASSYSMHPAIHPNNRLLVIRRSEYKTGDIITFRTYEEGKPILITHRIYGTSGNTYITKGDLNEGIDTLPVSDAQIVGKEIAILPYQFLFVLTVVIPFITILGCEIIKLLALVKK